MFAPAGQRVCGDVSASASEALPAVLQVNFALLDGEVVFRTVEGTKFHSAVAGRVLAFEADGYDTDGMSGWSVLVQGVSRVVMDRTECVAPNNSPLNPGQSKEPTGWLNHLHVGQRAPVPAATAIGTGGLARLRNGGRNLSGSPRTHTPVLRALVAQQVEDKTDEVVALANRSVALSYHAAEEGRGRRATRFGDSRAHAEESKAGLGEFVHRADFHCRDRAHAAAKVLVVRQPRH